MLRLSHFVTRLSPDGEINVSTCWSVGWFLTSEEKVTKLQILYSLFMWCIIHGSALMQNIEKDKDHQASQTSCIKSAIAVDL